jgi:hypothetical protein
MNQKRSKFISKYIQALRLCFNYFFFEKKHAPMDKKSLCPSGRAKINVTSALLCKFDRCDVFSSLFLSSQQVSLSSRTRAANLNSDVRVTVCLFTAAAQPNQPCGQVTGRMHHCPAHQPCREVAWLRSVERSLPVRVAGPGTGCASNRAGGAGAGRGARARRR